MTQPVTNVQAYKFSYSLAANSHTRWPVSLTPNASSPGWTYLTETDTAALHSMTKIKIARTSIPNSNSKAELDNFLAAYSRLKILLLVAATPNSAVSWTTEKATWDTLTPSTIYGFENVNEMNNFGAIDPTNPGDLSTNIGNTWSGFIKWCQALSGYVSGSSKWNPTPGSKSYLFGNYPILAPSLVGGPDALFGYDTSSTQYYDYGNLHHYPKQAPGNPAVIDTAGSNGDGGALINDWNNHLATIQPNKLMAITEFGHNTSFLGQTDWISQHAQAAVILNGWHDAVAYGAPVFSIYSLCDDDLDRSDDTDQQHYGVIGFRNTLDINGAYRKISGDAILYIMNLVEDFAGASYTPAYPTVSVTGMQNSSLMGQYLTIGRSDGTHFVSVWNEPRLWNTAGNNIGGVDITPATNNVTVNWTDNRNFRVHDPIAGSASSVTTGTSTVLGLKGYPLYIELQPGTVAPPITTISHLRKNQGNKFLLTPSGKLMIG